MIYDKYDSDCWSGFVLRRSYVCPVSSGDEDEKDTNY